MPDACRLGLARALYSYSPLLLLDDVLAALDAPCAEHITSALLGSRLQPGAGGRGPSAAGLLQGRTVVVVSNSHRCAPLFAVSVLSYKCGLALSCHEGGEGDGEKGAICIWPVSASST